MEIAKYPSACLPLAFALLLCLAVSTESQSYGHGGNQDQIRADDVQGRWCIAKPSAYNFELLRNIEYSCGQNGVDCGQIQPGGSCFRPDTAFGHASYAMNLFFKAAGKHPWDCHFNGTGIVVTQDPCKSPVEILVPGYFSNNDI
ncbi:PREDICTED: major pollen allergen Ole e 10-like [Populus euphratica]|uniref:Major pollen allergen Ole e 10-like n=1 Tax=Populus euphratica TaxID=75702 RepID=A0AAJ6XDF3_POPEU|nr:PREDICTED: major pollen allergen Ole e 10-like [Populus euphratica]